MDRIAKIVDQYTDHNVFNVPKVAYSIMELAAEPGQFGMHVASQTVSQWKLSLRSPFLK